MKTLFISSCSRLFLVCLAVVAAQTPGILTAQEEVLVPKDFSRTNSVTLSLMEAKRGNERWQQGLAHAFWEKDGRTTVMDVEGVSCRNLSLSADGRSKGYFLFAINPSFKNQDVSRVKIEVDYFDGFDGREGVFGLQYDATGADDAPLPSAKALLPMVPLKGSGKWLKAAFHVRDGTFENAQNARSDFRLVVSPPELSVSRVTVTLEPQLTNPPVPLKFGAAGEVKLHEWNPQWDTGAQPSFARGTNNAGGMPWLEVRASGSLVAGSWRTAVLLEPGEYQFVGRAKIDDAQTGIGATGGVMLRVSGKSGYKMATEAADWTPLEYNFAMSALDYVELVCDFRGSHGGARFEADSLKLIRKGQQKP